MWWPKDVGTWGLILGVAAIVLAIPLGIVSGLLAPRVQIWWVTRSKKTRVEKLIRLTEWREQLMEEPLITENEAMLFEQQVRLATGVHTVGYIVVLAVVFVVKWNDATKWDAWHWRNSIIRFIAPFLVLLIASLAYSVLTLKRFLWRRSPVERKKLDEEIIAVLNELQAKSPSPR